MLSNSASRRQWDIVCPEGQVQLMGRIHARRLGKPENIAAAAAILASRDAGWIIGQILSVDGGAT
jgi:3-oxoacyl-[acyl-carrier protein] reductase